VWTAAETDDSGSEDPPQPASPVAKAALATPHKRRTGLARPPDRGVATKAA
jgi:hypothetical protein